MRSGYEALARAVAGGAPLPGASPPAESSGGGAASTGQGSNPNPPAVAGAGSTERRAGPQKEKTLNCPRCNSTNTKFCYYNNYILQQPRYFCKTCHHYWTEGGSLRNVPVGGGSRKNNRSSSSSASASTSASVTSSSMASTAGAASKNPKLAHEGAQDLNLAFPHHGGLHAPEFAAFPSLESSHGNRAATYIFRGSRAKLNFPESATLRLPWAPQAAAAAPPPPPQKPEALQSLELNAQMRMLAAAGASPAQSPLAQGPHDTAASSSAPLAIVSVGMDSHPSEAAGYERQELAMHSPSSSSGTRNLHNLLPQEQQLVVAPPHFITRSSGGRGRNGGGPPDFIELLAQCLWREYLRSQ